LTEVDTNLQTIHEIAPSILNMQEGAVRGTLEVGQVPTTKRL